MSQTAGRRAHLAIAAAMLIVAAGCIGSDDAARPYLRALVLSDLNGSTGSRQYTPEVSQAVALATGELRADVVLIPGDMVAGQSPELSDAEVRAMWASFDRTVAAPLRAAGIPMVVTLGNHDGASDARHARDRRIAAEYWRERTARDALPFVEREHFPHRYSVRFGDVFVAVWDATHGESGANEELVEWLEDALDADEAEEARHRVVLAHVPLYDVSAPPYYPGNVLEDADDLREDLEDWGATMMVSGHHHAYYPGRRGRLELMHAGSLGTYPRTLKGDRAPPRRTITVMDFFPDSVRVTGYELDAARGSAAAIALESLPRVICGEGGWVARRDLVEVESACERPLWRRLIGR